MAKGGYREGAGRPKAAHTIQAEAAKKTLIEKFIKEKGPIFDALISKAKQGDVPAMKELFERVWGKEAQPMTGDFNFTSDVPDPVYKEILTRESQRADIKISGS